MVYDQWQAANEHQIIALNFSVNECIQSVRYSSFTGVAERGNKLPSLVVQCSTFEIGIKKFDPHFLHL